MTAEPSTAFLRDTDSIDALRADGPVQDAALAALHSLLVRAATAQARRMPAESQTLGERTVETLVQQSADEAMTSVLRRLDSFQGRSRFTTWAYKFALVQSASDLHRAAWRPRHVDVAEVDWLPDPTAGPDLHAEAGDLARAVAHGIRTQLSPHQRRVAHALIVEQIPIDVLAERLATTRGALYKTLHDLRARLRVHLQDTGHLPPSSPVRPGMEAAL